MGETLARGQASSPPAQLPALAQTVLGELITGSWGRKEQPALGSEGKAGQQKARLPGWGQPQLGRASPHDTEKEKGGDREAKRWRPRDLEAETKDLRGLHPCSLSPSKAPI